MAKNDDSLLAISLYGLDAHRFDGDSNDWKSSEIRQWLNGDFYNEAFNETEKTHIKSFETFLGILDNVFILSKEEAENTKYFANNEARRCKPTEYSLSNNAYTHDGYCVWWLRSTYPNMNNRYVYDINDDGSFNHAIVISYISTVRPAIWIKL